MKSDRFSVALWAMGRSTGHFWEFIRALKVSGAAVHEIPSMGERLSARLFGHC